MKLSKSEKIWLTLVAVFYALYNMPFVPGYDNATGALIHGACTLIPLWIAVYAGLFKVTKSYDTENKANAGLSKKESAASKEEVPTC